MDHEQIKLNAEIILLTVDSIEELKEELKNEVDEELREELKGSIEQSESEMMGRIDEIYHSNN